MPFAKAQTPKAGPVPTTMLGPLKWVGLGLAAGYIQDHLRAWGVQPAGDAGSYLQTARVLSIRATSRSSAAASRRA